MKLITRNNCEKRICKWYRGYRPGEEKPYCMAFKNIPDEIAFGDDLHLTRRRKQRNRYVFAQGTNPRIARPFRRRHMQNPHIFGRDTLCSTIRDIYMQTEDDSVQYWCRQAMTMSKNMYRALYDYKKMLLELGAPVEDHTREDWQLRTRDLYIKLDSIAMKKGADDEKE